MRAAPALLALALAASGCASAPRGPLSAKAFGELGLARLVLDEDYRGAARDLTRAIELDPSDPNLFVLRGMAYSGQGAKELAEADFKQAVSLDSGLRKALAPLMR